MSLSDRFSHTVWVATFQLPLYDLGAIEDAGRRAGMMMTITFCGWTPLSGALIQATRGFAATGYFAGGCMMLLSAVLMLITHHGWFNTYRWDICPPIRGYVVFGLSLKRMTVDGTQFCCTYLVYWKTKSADRNQNVTITWNE